MAGREVLVGGSARPAGSELTRSQPEPWRGASHSHTMAARCSRIILVAAIGGLLVVGASCEGECHPTRHVTRVAYLQAVVSLVASSIPYGPRIRISVS